MKTKFSFRETTRIDRMLTNLKFPQGKRAYAIRPKLSADQFEKINEIRKNGYLILPNYIGGESLELMKRELNAEFHDLNFEMPCLAQSKIDEARDSDLINNFMYSTPEGLSKRGLAVEREKCFDYEQVLKDFNPSTLTVKLLKKYQRFRDLWLDEFILGIVAGYLGTTPYLLEAYVRRNFPSKYKTMNHFWHRDMNHKHYLLKVFFFFSDCSVENGPHEYITGTHTRFDILNHKRYFDDRQVDAMFPLGSDERVTSIVKAGTVVIEDTRGVHRAQMPTSGLRDLGYAVFMPAKLPNDQVYYEIDKSDFACLSDFQRSFIPPTNVV